MKYYILTLKMTAIICQGGIPAQPAVSASRSVSYSGGSSHVKSCIDTARLTVVYTFHYAMDTPVKQVWKDRFILEVGNRYSHYYSLYADKSGSIIYAFMTSKASKKMNAGINPRTFLKAFEDINYDSYWFDNKSDSLMASDLVVNAFYTYTEPIPVIQWEMQSDTLRVVGYRCQLATATFRGRKYHAWFTFEIPVSRGPWKLTGLPGLILKAQTDDGYFKFEAIGVEIPKSAHPIYEQLYPYRKITRNTMLQFYRMTYEDPVGLIIQHGWRCFGADANGKDRQMQPGEMSFPYRPFLELE